MSRIQDLEARFAFNLGVERVRRGLSRRGLGVLAGMPHYTIERIEHQYRNRRATIGEVVVLAEALGLKPGELLK